MLRESSFAAVFLDDGNNFVIDETPSGLPDEFFFVVQLRIKIDEIHTGKSSHPILFPSRGARARDCSKAVLAPAMIPELGGESSSGGAFQRSGKSEQR
jgi:hypothetical protein